MPRDIDLDADDEYRPRPRFRCPYCGSDAVPVTRSKISVAGWAVFIALLIVCFPLCVLGLFIKDEFKECADCGTKIGG